MCYKSFTAIAMSLLPMSLFLGYTRICVLSKWTYTWSSRDYNCIFVYFAYISFFNHNVIVYSNVYCNISRHLVVFMFRTKWLFSKSYDKMMLSLCHNLDCSKTLIFVLNITAIVIGPRFIVTYFPKSKYIFSYKCDVIIS